MSSRRRCRKRRSTRSPTSCAARWASGSPATRCGPSRSSQRATCSTKASGPALLRHLIEGGDLSGYGLVNAVTHFAQEVDDYDRATEFEMLGGKLIEQSKAEWDTLAQAL